MTDGHRAPAGGRAQKAQGPSINRDFSWTCAFLESKGIITPRFNPHKLFIQASLNTHAIELLVF